tara:strand:+ start:6888 stop:7952 length:1065 start_codon:yes stop_codon:yes gene_type:complete
MILKYLYAKPLYEMPENLTNLLNHNQKHYLVTGGAGFIGSNIVEMLLRCNQRVTTLDNFSTGRMKNLNEVQSLVGKKNWGNHTLIDGDITSLSTCMDACKNVDIVLHQAALGSVPRSLANPLATHHANATGFLNMLVASKDTKVERFVYAASSSTYGDSKVLPKQEDVIGNPLSPYAVTKYVNELYASVFSKCYGLETVGLRYFNVFGPRQDPDGAYAAVIPKWIGTILNNERCVINGDGESSRDFCFVANAVQANLLSATTTNRQALNQVYNVAYGAQTSLDQLFNILKNGLVTYLPDLNVEDPKYNEFRDGDVRHSLADISKALNNIGYKPVYDLASGFDIAAQWYIDDITV